MNEKEQLHSYSKQAAQETANGNACSPFSIDYPEQPGTPLEFKKPLGTGSNVWPTTPTTYGYSTTCVRLDPLEEWFRTVANRDRFMHISHTFTHYELNNATYSDALKEIQFNQAWLQQVGFAAGRFSANALIPPAITGLHNGDVLRAWKDAGLTNCVGDNTRPPLRNQQNSMYAYKTTVAADGYEGFNVIPRWATRIYYNCDTPGKSLVDHDKTMLTSMQSAPPKSGLIRLPALELSRISSPWSDKTLCATSSVSITMGLCSIRPIFGPKASRPFQ